MTKKTDPQKAYEERERLRALGDLKILEMEEVARLIRIINHCLRRLLLILPSRLGPMNRASVDLLGAYGLFKGITSLLGRHKNSNLWDFKRDVKPMDFTEEASSENLKLTERPKE